jgi:DNA-binding GntR family transcriptional regulator
MSISPTSVDRVLDEFLERVRNGRYVPGQRLVAGDVARDLGCSRAPVREALHVLVGEGVLEMTPNQGARIRELTSQDLVDGMLLLKAVGALGIEFAAPKMKMPKNTKRINAQAKAVFGAADRRQPYAWFTELIELHREINEISANPYLNRQVFGRAHLVFFNRALAERLPGRHWEKYVRNYEAIIETLLSGDQRKAVSAFNTHMSWAIDLLRKEYLQS